ncbi:MAG: galactose-1-phosphate uridylyltransferase [Candidatus Woesearchaeota archaeon]
MGELRKDYILDRWVFYSARRGKRPKELRQEQIVIEPKDCFFCPGNESLTPPEIGRTGGKQWQMRWFANKFPALEPAGEAKPRTDNRFYTFASNYGYHEIIVETPDHQKQLELLSAKEICGVLGVYKERIKALEKKPGIKYVCVFKNHGYHAGTSIVHTHSQVMAIAFVPPAVREKIDAARRFIKCPYCDIVESERNSSRRCFENNDWLAFCPYASRYNYEVWIFPKNHIRTFDDITDVCSLAEILKQVLGKVAELNASYNLHVIYAPEGEDLHFHIEVIPEIAIWGGFERGSGAIINSVMPETAAAFYRGEPEE